MDKPNCYECKWRGNLPGESHSCCNHPSIRSINKDPMGQILGILASVGRLGIKANYHGIKNGWFNFPFNFDPIWLEKCNGFEHKD